MIRYIYNIVAVTVVMLGGCTKDTMVGSEVDSGAIEVQFSMPDNIGGDNRTMARVGANRGAIVASGGYGAVSATIPSVVSGTQKVDLPSTRANEQTRIVGTADEITEGESRLNTMVIMIFNEGGTVLETMLSTNLKSSNIASEQPNWSQKKSLTVKGIKDPMKKKIIYAIANWTLPTDFDQSTYTEAMLKVETTTKTSLTEMNDTKAYPITMSGRIVAANLATVNYKVTIGLKRLVAKIEAGFTISTQTQIYHPNILWETDKMKIAVVNAPNSSFVVENATSPSVPQGSTPFVPYYFAVDDTQPANGDQVTPPATPTKVLKWIETLYTHENPVSGNIQATTDKALQLKVQLPYTNRATGITDYDNYYLVYIKDTRPSESASPYKVLRNIHYALSISILGKGMTLDDLQPNGNIGIDIAVEPWADGGYIELGDMQHYLSIDRTSFEYQADGNTIKTALISTDIADWKILYNGSTFLSFSQDKTTNADQNFSYKLAGTPPNYTLTVTQTSSTDKTPIKYTLQAKNLKLPIVVVNDNGIIPSSVLKDSFIVKNSTYTGWQSGKLPVRGLQIAKRGNLLPLKAVLTDDPQAFWSTDAATHTGVAAPIDCGFGESNTAELFKLPVDKYPAVNECKELGPGWYLPSINELKQIYAHRELLGSSYTFIADEYWSSSEPSANDTWLLNFEYGDGNSNKTTNVRVRCVKNI